MAIRSLKDGAIVIKVADDGLGAPASVTVDIEEGDLEYTERAPANIIMDRGVLSHARSANEEPVEVSFSMHFQSFLVHAAPTPYEALKHVGDAAAWLSEEPNSDVWAVELEFQLADVGDGNSETVTFARFIPEEISFSEGDPADNLACSGRARTTAPAVA